MGLTSDFLLGTLLTGGQVLDDEIAESTAMVQALAITGCHSASDIARAIAEEPAAIAEKLMRDTTKIADVARLATEKAMQGPSTAAFLAGVGLRKVDASLRLLEWQSSNDNNDTTGYIDWVRTTWQARMDRIEIQLETYRKLFLIIAEKAGPETVQKVKKAIEDMQNELETKRKEEERQFEEEVAERRAHAEANGYNEDDSE
ncbi:hypothetical protein QBC40DRAFT_296697 [Triangularia verruculosa]|uniref:Uncharacterized protein n=1 Tax=Triangularia verruculosa TaxID=2587418 RepID=A0AAN7AWY1_9PEZI|nr:hypothetical protein QBC40DRAFT_296697 [Triangularia verruculosa]